MKVETLNGYVNFSHGTILEAREIRLSPDSTDTDIYLFHQNDLICSENSNLVKQYMVKFDEYAEKRSMLIDRIFKSLKCDPTKPVQYKLDTVTRSKWLKVWEDPVCKKYKNTYHEDFWLWNLKFFQASVDDLEYIANLVKP